MKALAIIAAFACLAAAGGQVHFHNQLVALDVETDTQWKQVENQLARQYELLPKLATVAKRYVEHERGVLDALFTSRQRYQDTEQGERPKLAGEFEGVVVQALALAERYPDLKADGQYRDLAFEIAGTKNRIAVERKRYNDTVGLLNARLRQVPWSWFAGDIEPREFYEVKADALVEPELEI